jgi:uncharacterized protein (DUF305 family)
VLGSPQRPASHAETTTNPAWAAFLSSLDQMHAAMMSVAPSGNSDVDFVKLMLPHHQAAIDMAKTQLLYGKDPQMRRLPKRSSPTSNRRSN